MAAEAFEFSLDGVRELERTLKMLPELVAEREMRRAARAGARVVRKAVMEAAPHIGDNSTLGSDESSKWSKRFGPLHKNIRVTTRKETRHSVEVAVHTGPAFWGLFLEVGTSRMAARPFFTPAWDSSAPAALNKIGVTLGRGIDRSAKELALRNKTRRLSRSTRRLL